MSIHSLGHSSKHTVVYVVALSLFFLCVGNSNTRVVVSGLPYVESFYFTDIHWARSCHLLIGPFLK